MISIKELTDSDFNNVKELFVSVFTKEPWNDDWSNENQLNEYLKDIMMARNPLNLGLYDDQELVGISLGYIKHWCNGTEYYIDELCIRTERQGQGLGTKFFEKAKIAGVTAEEIVVNPLMAEFVIENGDQKIGMCVIDYTGTKPKVSQIHLKEEFCGKGIEEDIGNTLEASNKN